MAAAVATGLCASIASAAADPVAIRFVNGAGIPASDVRSFERAAVLQAQQLRIWWHTPRVRFAHRGWSLAIFPPNDPRLGRHLGGHGFSTRSFAVVADTPNWTHIASHELLEMLVDPTLDVALNGYSVEVCDPVKTLAYNVSGVSMADFVTPAWFSGITGPYDFLNRVTSARSVEFGFAYQITPGKGKVIVGNGPF